jgi:hypothetical protein
VSSTKRSPLKGRKLSAETLAKRAATRAARKAQMEIPLDAIPDEPKQPKKYTKRKDPVLDTIKVLLTTALVLIERG